MLSFHQIRTIAHFEAKTLFRSWFFRILGILMLTIIFFFNLAMVVFGGSNDGQIQHAVPSAIPYSNLMFYNVVQAIIAIFLASDFLKRDKKLDTTEVIYTRSMSNGDYVIGKLLGNLGVFTTLNLVILGMALVFNLIMGFSTVIWSSYIYYFLLISIPTLIFIIGLSFILMNILKNQAVTFAILIGYVFLTMFYLKDQYYYLFDYMVYNIPMLYSDFIGFINLKLLLIHRGMYILLGLSFISLSIFKLWRLPNKPFSNLYPLVLAVVFMMGGVYLGFVHVKESMRGETLRKEMVQLNNKYSNSPRASITNQDIKLKHSKNSIEAACRIKAVNRSGKPIDSLIISLNPGLLVSKITIKSEAVNFSRSYHLILIPLANSLGIKDSLEIGISYAGIVDDEACYIDIDEKSRKETEESNMVNIGKIFSYVSEKFVFLTPESNWYPNTIVGFNQRNTLWMLPDFCKYNLEVTAIAGMTVISQGASTKVENTTNFSNYKSMPGLSLIIGEYLKSSFTSQKPEIGVFHMKGHDYFQKAFAALKDTSEKIVYKSFEDYSLRLKINYPYQQLYLVEIPIQIGGIQRYWSNHIEMVQPELIFVPEKGGQNRRFNFEANIKDKKESSESKGLSDKELQSEELNNFLNSFTKKISSSNFRYRNNRMEEEELVNPLFIFDEFYAYNHPIESQKFPIFNTLLGAYYQKKALSTNENGYSFGFSEEEKAVLLLQKKSLSEIMLNPDYNNLADNLVMLKGDALFSLLEKKVGKTKLDEMLIDLFAKYQNQVISFDQFSVLLKEKTGQDIETLLNFWLKSEKLPAFRAGSVDAFKVNDGERQRYLTRLSVGNDGDIEGIVKIAIRVTGNNDSEDEKIDYQTYDIGVNQIKKISILTDRQPSTVIVNTNASKNIPVKQEISIFKVDANDYIKAVNEEKVEPLTVWDESNEVIVDNEDSLFVTKNITKKGLLIRIANKIQVPGDEYQGYMWWFVSGKWSKFVNTMFYGKYLHSAEAIRSSNGDSKAAWKIPIKEKGQYNIYTFIPKQKGEEENQHLGDYHYTITTDDGVNSVIVNCKEVDGGWNLLGTYYCSPENTKVELNNQSKSRVVIADAVKAVKL